MTTMTTMTMSLVHRLPVLLLLGAILTATGCGPLLRQKSMNEAKEYFTSTPIEQHTPQKGGAASWHLIKDPEASRPILLEGIQSEDMVTAGTSIILLQVVAGKRHNAELIEAIDSRDWSQAPGHLADYIKMVEPEIRKGSKGMVEP